MAGTKRVAIIGAGSTGLTAARHAILYGFEPVVFEKSIGIGGIWDYSDNPEERSVAFGTAMLDSKELSAFSDFPPPAKTSTFMNHTEVLEYLKAYADVHDLYPFIRLKNEVVSIRRVEAWEETGRWTVEYVDSLGSKSSEAFEAVLLCTGMHSTPWRPLAWRHEDRFKGQVIHSFNYKNSSAYHDKVVVVVGGGNSAVHIASDLAGVAKQVHWSTRRGAWILNRVGKTGAPWDLSYNSRFHALGRKLVPKPLRNLLWKRELDNRLDHKAYGVEPKHGFSESHLTFGDHLADLLATGRIQVHADLLSFQENGVEFADKNVVEGVDAVIICTGYEFDFSFVEDGKTLFVNWNDFHLYKLMFPPLLSKHNTLAVLGHVQPTGSLLPIAEMQARFFFHALSGQLKLPSAFDMKESLEFRRCDMSMNFVKSRRHAQIEDYVEYMNDLASRIGAKPNLVNLMKSDPVLAMHCFFGPALPYQYRLEGAHVWPGARNAIIAAQERLYPTGKASEHVPLWVYLLIVAIGFWLFSAVLL